MVSTSAKLKSSRTASKISADECCDVYIVQDGVRGRGTYDIASDHAKGKFALGEGGGSIVRMFPSIPSFAFV